MPEIKLSQNVQKILDKWTKYFIQLYFEKICGTVIIQERNNLDNGAKRIIFILLLEREEEKWMIL